MATVWDEAEQDRVGREVLKLSTEEIIQCPWLLDMKSRL